MDRLSVPIEWKAADDGTLEGWASTFGNVDLGDDVVTQGAFKTTIPDIKANGIPLLADHVASTASVLGTIFDAEEVTKGPKKGLRIKARFSAAPSAQDVRTKLVEGHLKSLSIGYSATKYSFSEVDGKTVRNLDEIKLWETSVVVFPMNTEATISRVKSLVGSLTPEAKTALVSELTEVESDPNDTPADGETVAVESAVTQAADSNTSDQSTDAPAGQSEQAAGWDHYVSEAVLAGGDPEAIADPAQRAGLATRLDLLEQSLEAMSAPTDPEVRAGLAASLRLMEDDIQQATSSVPAGTRGDLEQRLALLEDHSE